MSNQKEFWKGKNVLITGHTGFKGSWLTLLLDRLEANITGYSIDSDNENKLYTDYISKFSCTFKHILGDIRNREYLNEKINKYYPDIIFHLAAQPLVRESYKDPTGTWTTNVIGTMNLLDCLKSYSKKCAIVIVTTDKVYINKEWDYGYREEDELGGLDPYSSSKAATEIAVKSWRESFCGYLDHQNKYLKIATARSGNVIGGGDWSTDRIIPDCIRAIEANNQIIIRSPNSTRPWQHVLDCLNGYIELAEHLYTVDNAYCESFNFGPSIRSNRKVIDVAEMILKIWPSSNEISIAQSELHESKLLSLCSDKSWKLLNWYPRYDFEESIRATVKWYRDVAFGSNAFERTIKDIDKFLSRL